MERTAEIPTVKTEETEDSEATKKIEDSQDTDVSVPLCTLVLRFRDLSTLVKNTGITSTFDLRCIAVLAMDCENFNDFEKDNAEFIELIDFETKRKKCRCFFTFYKFGNFFFFEIF